MPSAMAAAGYGYVLVLCGLARHAAAAVPADAVLSMPGWDGPLPSKQYSGFLGAAAGQEVHYHLSLSEGDPATDPLVLWVQVRVRPMLRHP